MSRPRLTLAWERSGDELRATLFLNELEPSLPSKVAAAIPASRPVSLPEGWLAKLRQAPREEQVEAGERFTGALVPEPIARAMAGVLSGAATLLPLEIRSADTEVLHLPWELLHLPDLGLLVGSGRVEPYRRVLAAGESLEPAPDVAGGIADRRLAVLGFTSSPNADQNLRRGLGAAGFVDPNLFWEREQERLLVAMEPLLRQGRGELHLPDEGSVEQLARLMGVIQQLDILHLACHGGVRQEPDGPRPKIVLEEEDGSYHEIGAEELGARIRSALGGRSLPLTVLGACDSAAASSGTASAVRVVPSFAATLLQFGVERVVGFQEKVSDLGATSFAAAVYASLARGEDLIAAMRSGRVALEREGKVGEWLLPALFVVRDANPLVTRRQPATPTGPTLQTWRGDLVVAGVSYREQNYVGRRYLERELSRAWRSGRRLLVLHGLGGIGKSTLACRFLERRRAEGCRVLSLYAGRSLTAEDVRADLARQLGVDAPDPSAAADAEVLERRWDEVLEAALAPGPETFYLLDNFEDHQDAEGGLTDPAIGGLLSKTLELSRGRLCLVVTSRLALRLPAVMADQVKHSQHDVGELPASACRKLRVLDPHGLGALGENDWRRTLDLIGGHPKALQLLGAHLRQNPERARRFLEGFGESLATVDSALAAEQQERGRRLLIADLLDDLPVEHLQTFVRLCLLTVPVDPLALTALLEAEGAAAVASSFDWLERRGLLATSLGEAGLGLQVHRLVSRCRLASHPVELPHWHRRLAKFFENREDGPDADFGVAAHHADACGDRARALGLYVRWSLQLRKGFYFRAGEQIARQGLDRFPPTDDPARAAAAKLWLEIFEAGESLGEPQLREEALTAGQQLLNHNECSLAISARAGHSFCRGRLELQRGEIESAERFFAQAVDLCRQAGEPREAAVALAELANIEQQRGEFDRALEIRQHRVLPIFEQLGATRDRAVALAKNAEILRIRRHYAASLRILEEEVLPAYEQLDEWRERALAYVTIADIHQDRGDLDEALSIRQNKALPALQELDDRHACAGVRGRIADIYLLRGNLDEALGIYQEQLQVYEKLGDLREKTMMLGRIADIYQMRRRFADALRIRHKQLEIYEMLGDARALATAWSKIGDIHHANGEFEEALEIWRDRELPVLERLGDTRNRSITLGRIADVLQDQGQFDAARRLQEERLALNLAMDDPSGIAATRYRLGSLAMAAGDLSAAEPQLREAWEFFERIDAAKEIAWIGTDFGICLAKKGRAAEALKVWQRALFVWRQLGHEIMVQRVEEMIAAL